MKCRKYNTAPFIFLIVAFFTAIVAYSCTNEETDKKENPGLHSMNDGVFIPVAGNSWVVNDYRKSSELVSGDGIQNWSSKEDTIRTFFRTSQAGSLSLGLKVKPGSGISTLKIILGEKNKKIEIEQTDEYQNLFVGEFEVDAAGYQEVDICGVSTDGKYFAEISHLIINGNAAPASVKYVKDDFYWGRRGPSVHLGYKIPENSGNIEYFYSEVTVPEGNDVPGSYFMADGFAHGYFGMQVNSLTERRVLFSVWSPYSTDNPEEIPEDKRVLLLGKGDDVHTGEFGNEGSGGQSYKVFNWTAGKTYGFLLQGKPAEEDYTKYTAWFFDPDTEEWFLIASFKRPETNTYLTSLYSFLENFITDFGAVTRKAFYSGQWVVNTEGQWIEISEATFTADATARKEARMDYAGGSDKEIFFLENCGFFDETTSIGTLLDRESTDLHPDICFDQLPRGN